jgi:hypothetical protein
MRECEIEPGARDQLERGQLIGGDGTGAGKQSHRVLDPREAEERSLDSARLGKKFDRRGRDDSESALAADEELLQIVPRIVLAQPAQSVPDAPVRQHDLEAQGQLAGIAVAQYGNPAGVGR